MTDRYAAEREAAVAAVRRAGVVTQAVQRALVTEDTLQKKDKSPVTVADFASQAVVCRLLGEALPVVGEEDAAELRQEANAALRRSVVEQVNKVLGEGDEEQVLAWIDRGGFDPREDAAKGRYWTLDPIDGTKGFLRGEQYAIALALIEEGQVVLAVMGCPNLPGPTGHGVLMTAVRGQGARQLAMDGDDTGGEPIRVSGIQKPAEARFCESVESGHSDQDQSAQIAKSLGIGQPPVRMDSQAKYAAVARGDASIYLRLPTRADYREKIWDHAAGMLVVQEAGGRVTDVHGRDLDFGHGRKLERNQGIIATNGPIHDEVVAAVRHVLEG